MILEGRQLTIGYQDRVVGAGLNVKLENGEVLALLGPNGGGKTTLLKTLLGLLSPKAGEVWLDGAALSSRTIRERARLIAYVPQTHIATFAFSVEAVVLMGRTAHGDLFARPTSQDRMVAAAMLDRLGIAQLAQRPYTMISGGERQLVLLARALAQEPQISTSAIRARSCARSARLPAPALVSSSPPMIPIMRCAPRIALICCVTASASPRGRSNRF